MSTVQIDVERLRVDYPKRFEKEWQRWVESWHDPRYISEYPIDDLCAMARELGISVEADEVQWALHYSQGDGVGFRAGVHLADWMKAKGHDEEYPALWAVADVANDTISVDCYNRGFHMHCSAGPSYEYVAPVGIFEGLTEETFSALVSEQYEELDPERLILEDCESLAHEAYKAIRAEYEYQTSAESFVEWALSDDYFFEVDPDSEE